MTGSHIDIGVHGGRFDGVAGVVVALEVARVMVEHIPPGPRHPQCRRRTTRMPPREYGAAGDPIAARAKGKFLSSMWMTPARTERRNWPAFRPASSSIGTIAIGAMAAIKRRATDLPQTRARIL